jgi:flagellar protein FlaJ
MPTKTEDRIPLMFINFQAGAKLSKIFLGISREILKLTSGLKYDLENTDLDVKPDAYIANSILNGLIFFFLFGGLLYFLNTVKQQPNPIFKSIAYAILIFFLIMYLFLKYPKIIGGKKAELIDKHLIFALKDMRLQISSGVTLYNAIVNVSNADYGQASFEFQKVAQRVNTGTPLAKALEDMAFKSKSDFLRKTIWQLVNTLKAGASLKGALTTIIEDLTLDQKDKIKRYAQELNLWVLMYMLFAVAVPTIGITLLVILSSFAGFGINQAFFIFFVIMCVIIQIVLIGFMKTRRPVVLS